MYSRTTFQVSNITQTSFRQGEKGNFTSPSPHTSKRTPKKPTHIRVKIIFDIKSKLNSSHTRYGNIISKCTQNIYLEILKTYLRKNCSKRFIVTKKKLELQSATWSDYNHHNTAEFLVLCFSQFSNNIIKSLH